MIPTREVVTVIVTTLGGNMDLSEQRKTELFVDLYITALRAAYKNQWLQPPKGDSEKWKQLEAARKIVDEMDGSYGDFIRCQFAAMRKFKLVPAPHHLSSRNAVQRYMVHQKMKNLHHYSTYSVEGDDLIVHATMKHYPLEQADLPTKEDPEANYAHHISNTDCASGDTTKDIESIEYAIAKLKYKDRIPTEALLRKLKQLKEKTTDY